MSELHITEKQKIIRYCIELNYWDALWFPTVPTTSTHFAPGIYLPSFSYPCPSANFVYMFLFPFPPPARYPFAMVRDSSRNWVKIKL